MVSVFQMQRKKILWVDLGIVEKRNSFGGSRVCLEVRERIKCPKRGMDTDPGEKIRARGKKKRDWLKLCELWGPSGGLSDRKKTASKKGTREYPLLSEHYSCEGATKREA